MQYRKVVAALRETDLCFNTPVAFQNTEAELTQCGHDSWKWSAEGDNAGKTMKIIDHWYYFEASF